MNTKKLLAIVAICATTASASYAGDWWVSAGSAPTSEGGGTSIAIATKGSNNFGYGLGVVFNSEFSDKTLLDYPVPHNFYKNLGAKRTGNSIGLDGYYFLGDSKKVRPYVGMGLYYAPRAEVAQSTATGWYYTQSTKSAMTLSGELGLQFVSDSGYTFGAGYHTVRGANISFGKAL